MFVFYSVGNNGPKFVCVLNSRRAQLAAKEAWHPSECNTSLCFWLGEEGDK